MLPRSGLRPWAFGINLPGQEIEGPMAIIVPGRIAVVDPAELFELPMLAQRYVRPTAPARATIKARSDNFA
jgi:hypothetical protein